MVHMRNATRCRQSERPSPYELIGAGKMKQLPGQGQQVESVTNPKPDRWRGVPMDLSSRIAASHLPTKSPNMTNIYNYMADNVSLAQAGFQAEYYFYCSLMDHTVLARVLQKHHRPEIYPASLKGWQCKMWGEHPALVHRPGYTTKGTAYEVRSPWERDRLIEYETDAYKVQPCLINVGHEYSVQGKTFVWDDDPELLRYGTFDLKDWLLKQKEFEVQQFH